MQKNALSAAVKQRKTSTQFYNLVVTQDDVLDVLGENFHPEDDNKCIGHDGLGVAVPNWIDFYSGQYFEGDDPHSVGDHHWTYTNPDNQQWLNALVHGNFYFTRVDSNGVLKS